MKVKEFKLTEVTKIRATVEGFDPVTVYLEDIPIRDDVVCGKLILEADGDAWCYYHWVAMGEGKTLRTFLLQAADDYIACKLGRGNVWEIDYDKIAEESGAEIEGQTGDTLTDEQYGLLEKCYGEAWSHDLPQMHTMEYRRVMQAVNVMKQAIEMEGKRNRDYEQALGRIYRKPATLDDLGGTAPKQFTLAELNYKLLAYDKKNDLGHAWIRPLVEHLHSEG